MDVTEVFFSSDHHFGHERILELSGRPFGSIEEHDEAFVANHNQAVNPQGLTIFLGDVALGDRARGLALLSRMNGRKILIAGNHDKCFFGASNGHSHVQTYMDAGFELVVPWMSFKLPQTAKGRRGREVLLSHFPYDGDSQGEDRHSGARLRDEGVPLVHGHVHGEYKHRRSQATGAMQINVGVDVWDYHPVSAREVASLFDELEVSS